MRERFFMIGTPHEIKRKTVSFTLNLLIMFNSSLQ